jgi:phage tail sheath gpL-like
MPTLTLVLESNKDKGTLDEITVKTQALQYLKELASGNVWGRAWRFTSTGTPAFASGTVTLASVPEDDTVTIGGITFTAKASPSGEAQFSQAGSDTADAASLASKINAHSTLSAVVSATSALGVVTITCRFPGVVGNFITLAETGTSMTVSGARLSGGVGGISGAGTLLGD